MRKPKRRSRKRMYMPFTIPAYLTAKEHSAVLEEDWKLRKRLRCSCKRIIRGASFSKLLVNYVLHLGEVRET